MSFLRKGLRVVPATLFLCCNVCLLYPQKSLPVVEDFDLEGTALWECRCTAHACPCQKNGAPEHGTCEAADFVHIHPGRYGKLRLDGVNAVLVGNLVDKNESRLYATIYINQKADSPQREAITAIIQFVNGSYETSPLHASQVRAVPMAFFHLSKKMYDQKEMLGQYGDFSGHWTREQLDLIHKQGLKRIRNL